MPFINSGSINANGIDLGLQYVYPTSFGTFTSLTNVSYLNKFDLKTTPTSDTQAPGRCCGRQRCLHRRLTVI